MLKKWNGYILAIIVMFGSLSLQPVKSINAAEAKGIVFKDTSKHWAKTQIELAVQKGYVNGFPDGTFKPDAEVTRAQFIKMIVKALGLEHEAEGSVWYTTYVKAAKAAGIYQGEVDFAEWNVNAKISREHMAWLAVRGADDSLVTVESAGITKTVQTNRWPLTTTNNEVTRTDAFMRDYYEDFLVHTAFKRGVLNGFGGKEVGIERTTTRAQSVTVIERILSLKQGKKLPSDKYATSEAELLWLKTNAFSVAPHIFNDPKGSSMLKNYKLENLVFQNSIIHSEVKRIILIDLDDPKDPYRKLLPETKKLGFRYVKNIGKLPSDAYAMYIEYETHYNKNPDQYPGVVDVTTQSYKEPNPYPIDKLVDPSEIMTKEKGFEHINAYVPSDQKSKTGEGVVVWAIPNSGYSLYENTGENRKKLDRLLSLSFYVNPSYGENANISNSIFFGTTTHYGK
ncbi:S-layer homology domain-containing protein [Paenibacillus sp. GSMTC-2017]|uniref:S-layer homology domain-containing protein n=1 Tax=Paenibacillus sp. GSMTC-2017 TaxID=2794350 RepID=UPI0018D6EB8C|nr:S-layer homology domain-containing protein [Paenibacillus sp. GSMTC-2017]MBH5318292.1 S-layer homology domain-containing protein [Paenibacillus sp. GSMTC-2017]